MRKRIIIGIALFVTIGLALYLHFSKGPGLLESLRQQIHGE